MKLLNVIITTAYLSLMVLLSSCSTHIPEDIRTPGTGMPELTQVRSAPASYLSEKVRWGGVILKTENKPDTSQLTIIAFPLSDNGKPEISRQSPGRFIAVVDGFLEPLVYSTDRLITITGSLEESQTQKIGDYPYNYPVVKVEQHYLWEPEPEYNESDYPPYWWYDPWYHPYYPYHPYRYNR